MVKVLVVLEQHQYIMVDLVMGVVDQVVLMVLKEEQAAIVIVVVVSMVVEAVVEPIVLHPVAQVVVQ